MWSHLFFGCIFYLGVGGEIASAQNTLDTVDLSSFAFSGRFKNFSTLIINTIDKSLYTYRVRVRMKGANPPEFRIHGILINYDAL